MGSSLCDATGWLRFMGVTVHNWVGLLYFELTNCSEGWPRRPLQSSVASCAPVDRERATIEYLRTRSNVSGRSAKRVDQSSKAAPGAKDLIQWLPERAPVSCFVHRSK